MTDSVEPEVSANEIIESFRQLLVPQTVEERLGTPEEIREMFEETPLPESAHAEILALRDRVINRLELCENGNEVAYVITDVALAMAHSTPGGPEGLHYITLALIPEERVKQLIPNDPEE